MLKRCATVAISLFCLGVVVSGCKTIPPSANAPLPGLSADQLARFNDSFDNLDDDFWEPTYFTREEAQRESFKPGQMLVKDGKLLITTKTGAFSKAGMRTRFYLNGDFDIQMDCELLFSKQAMSMDQRVMFTLVVKGKQVLEIVKPIVNFIKKSGKQGMVVTGCSKGWQLRRTYRRQLEGFDGTVRFVRKGKRVVILIKGKQDLAWQKTGWCTVSGKEMFFGFNVENFLPDRISIQADYPVSARFDNFKINSVDKIVESEI